MKNRFHLFIAISLLLNLLVAPFLSLNTVQAQSSSETPYGWDLETSLSPELLAKFESTDTDLTGTLQSEGLQVERNGDQLKITGMGGMDELRRVFFEHLVESNPLISNRSDFKITLPFEDGQTLTVKLEANITTGYAWQFSGAEGVTLTQEGDTLYEDRPEAPIKGSPQIATLVFKASGTGTGTLTLAYKRSYGPDEAPLTRLNLNLETNPGEIDLSNPNPVLSAQMENLDLITSSAVSDVPMVGLPSSWDWRTQGIVPPIRDQGGCGSCWAFATVGAMESAIAKGGGPITDLSEQFLVSCNNDGYGCGGGNVLAQKYHVYQAAKNQTDVGAVLESKKPYSASNGTCTVAYDHDYQGLQWGYVAGNWFTKPTTTQLKNAIYTYGPITVDVCVGSKFNSYSGGVFSTDESSACGNSLQVNHAVVLVGWNDSNQTWIMRNSWNTWWGDDGYMYIKWGTSQIGAEATWVTYENMVPPAVPTTIAPSGNIDITKPAFVWERLQTAKSYQLSVYNSTTGQDVYTTTVSSSSCSTSTNQCTYTPSTALVYNNNYQWKVLASNNGGSSGYSTPVNFSPRAEVPAVPSLQSPSGDFFTTTKPAYIWSRAAIATSYKLIVYDVAGAKNVVDLSVSSSYCSTTTNLCTYTPSTTLTQYKNYTWKVMATSAKGVSSAYSSPVGFRSILAVPVASSPSGDIATAKPAYVWSRVSSATTYKLTVYADSGATTVIDSNVSSSYCSTTTNKCTYTPATVLTPNKDYRWKVVASNSYGSSVESSTLNFKPTAPSAPVAETPSGNVTTTKPAYVWTRISNATAYKLTVLDVSGAKAVINLSVSSSSCSTTTNKCTYTPSTTLTRYKDYQWKVLATNAVGSSPDSNLVSFKPVLPIPVTYTPTGNIASLKPAYVWSRISGATSYLLTVNDVTAGSNLLTMSISSSVCSSTTNKCTYTPPAVLTLKNNYQWKVMAVSAAGNSAESSLISFKPAPPDVPVTDSPVGSIYTTKPAYVWSRISGASSYKLTVYDVTNSANVITVINLSVSSSYCSSTTNKCTYTPSTALSLDDKDYQWKVLAANAIGSSPDSNLVNFKPVLPPTPTTYTPTGNITATKPAYVWSRVSVASKYRLYIYDIAALKYILISTVSSSVCSTTTDRCTYTPSTTLTLNKDYKWKVLSITSSGLESPHSGFVNFKVVSP